MFKTVIKNSALNEVKQFKNYNDAYDYLKSIIDYVKQYGNDDFTFTIYQNNEVKFYEKF